MTSVPDFMPVLSRGAHRNPQDGACVMEMVSYLVGENWSDTPSCTARIISVLAQTVNDKVSDDNRAKIALMIPRLIGTSELNNEFTTKHTEFYTLLGQLWKEFPEFDVPENALPQTFVARIMTHFRTETDESKRFTNEEYDDAMIRVLTRVLDCADEALGRNEYAVTTEEAFAKVAELPNQKVSA